MAEIKSLGYIKYLLSKSVLTELLGSNLITVQEFEAIDNENKKAFQIP